MHRLMLAYRKAKVDAYYSSHPAILDIAHYEENLTKNLKELQNLLSREEVSLEAAFLGDWFLVPKSISLGEETEAIVIASDAERWDRRTSSAVRPIATFRMMARPTMNFHVLSALWLMEVGALFEERLGRCAYGYRMRRTREGTVNELSAGSFEPYLKPFRNWRDSGIRAMREGLDAGKRVLALTADVTSFYHKLTPDFLCDKHFWDEIGVQLNDSQIRLNNIFVRALKEWAAATPIGKGLPVGLPASAVVANVALYEFDRRILENLSPLYYGRYVDDIVLVLEDHGQSRSAQSFWEWASGKLDGVLRIESSKGKAIFAPAYHAGSEIAFDNKKNKLFILSGQAGRALVDSIEKQAQERASEWRAMPSLPESADEVTMQIVAATQKDGDGVDTLRKADSLSTRRSNFALTLRDFEAYERDLDPAEWKEHRHRFLRAFVEHVLYPEKLFELSQYLPRVVRLAVASEDFEHALQIVRGVQEVCETVLRDCELTIKAASNLTYGVAVKRWREATLRSIYESVLSAFPGHLSREGRRNWQRFGRKILEATGSIGLAYKSVHELKRALFVRDLAHTPFRFVCLPKEIVAIRGIPAGIDASLPRQSSPHPKVTRACKILASWMTQRDLSQTPGLLFPTRPLSLQEICLIAPDIRESRSIDDVLLGMRGYKHEYTWGQWEASDGIIDIPFGPTAGRFGIALSCWQTLDESWAAAAMGSTEPDSTRYPRLARLVNSLLRQPASARYLILPELALPARWFMRVANKLRGKGISLITGIEYLHGDGKVVANSAWAALVQRSPTGNSMVVYRQDKQVPAFHEEQELWRLAGLRMQAKSEWTSPPIIRHGDFQFSILICSELTNIAYRAALRGKVDALFVPEWNRDTDSFEALVESAALDVHAYIIQCNDRKYGDSRIRAPYKDGWRRDILRVKGGIEDYCVVGEIDVAELRRFQSTFRSPSHPFKPLPDGFQIARERSVFSEKNL